MQNSISFAFAVHTLWQMTYETFHKMFHAFSSRKQFFQALLTLSHLPPPRLCQGRIGENLK